MSSRFLRSSGVAAIAVMLAFVFSQAFAQSDDGDPEMRIQRLENQLRQLTGQNEELQYRNRQLEDRLRQLGGAPWRPAANPPSPSPAWSHCRRSPSPIRHRGNRSPAGYGQPQPGYSQPQRGYDQQPQIAAPAPIIQEPPAPQAPGRRRGDAFDPNQNPNAPGAPRALGGGQLPIADDAGVGAPGGRGPGEPLDLSNTSPAGAGAPPPRGPGASAALTTLPPSATPKDEFDLGIGYMQRKDYALAEETMKNFAQKYPSDPLVADSQYWLGESYFQRQQYRDAAETFLGGDHQIRQIGQGARCVVAARPVAGGAEGKGSRLRCVRRSDAEISARLGRRQSRRRPRAEAG